MASAFSLEFDHALYQVTSRGGRRELIYRDYALTKVLFFQTATAASQFREVDLESNVCIAKLSTSARR